jgi:hypothetical protein
MPEMPQPIPGRGVYIPGWCYWLKNRDADHGTQVLYDDGSPRGFCVKDVLPERRWAVQPSGHVMDQDSFEKQYMMWLSGFPTEANFRPSDEAIPRADYWISKKLDHDGRLVNMEFDEFAAPAEPLVAKHNQEGEVSQKWVQEQQGNIEEKARIDTLRELHKAGVLSDEAFIDAIQGGPAAVSVDPEGVGEAEEPNDTVASVPPTQTQGARCGKMVRTGYVKQHEMRCGKCKELVEGE